MLCHYWINRYDGEDEAKESLAALRPAPQRTDEFYGIYKRRIE